MSKQNSMKTVLMAAALCALAGMANTASAVERCNENDGHCASRQVQAGADRKVSYRCTVNLPGIDFGNCKIIEVATGKFPVNDNFRGDTGNKVTGTLPTPDGYRCAVETNGPNLPGHVVFCQIN